MNSTNFSKSRVYLIVAKDKVMKLANGWIAKKYSSFERMFANEENKPNKNILNKVLFTVLLCGLSVAVILFVFDLYLINFKTEMGDFGAFGDFFGGVLNPILTFLTLFGLITTIVIQRQELRLARVEYEKTATALSTQAIEATFFNILDLHHKIVDHIRVDLKEIIPIMNSPKTQTKELFAKTLQIAAALSVRALPLIIPKLATIKNEVDEIPVQTVFEGRIAFEALLNVLSIETDSLKEVVERYKRIQDDSNHVLGHYFKNLYQALKVIDSYDNRTLSATQKKKYTSILRAQLSAKELALLFINCLEGVSDSGQFKNLLIEYAMFEHLPIKKVDNGYCLAGSTYPIADDDMFIQYENKKEFDMSANKQAYGAFGNNTDTPLNKTSE
jgi:hypothetical protein